MEVDELKERLVAASAALKTGNGSLTAPVSRLPPGDPEEAASRLIGEIGGLLDAWKIELDEGGHAGLLHFAPYQLEMMILELVRAAYAAGVQVVPLETTGWNDEIHDGGEGVPKEVFGVWGGGQP